jgi:DNA-binding MarR family transcriptional regulator/L-amino acid N-acyltransferase YncA
MPEPLPTDAARPDAIDRIRAFNRFYTRRLDLLDRGFLASPWTLGEVRILWELSRRPAAAAADLARELGIDPAQLSRTLKRLEGAGLVARVGDPHDGRRSAVALSEPGRATLAPLEAEQKRRVAEGIAGLSPEAVIRLVDAMDDIERLLDPAARETAAVIRPHRTGDVAEVIARQARLYATEYGFDARFETLIAGIGAEFLAHFDPCRDASFIAEVEGRIVGAVFVTAAAADVAKLRLLHVESEMRGRGLGRRLVESAIGFARAQGYRRMTLWTNDTLCEARRLYERAGFRCVGREPHTMFGPPLVGETWDLDLTA